MGKEIIELIYIKKKKVEHVCKNYRVINFLNGLGKQFTKSLEMRMKRYVEAVLAGEQVGYLDQDKVQRISSLWSGRYQRNTCNWFDCILTTL